MLQLYFWPTGNNKKVIILLEELGLPYEVKPININEGDQFSPEFLKISPNNRVPAIVDNDPAAGKVPVSIFESGAILMYLAEKCGRFWPQERHQKYAVAQWVFWQVSNQGPKMGEHGHFRKAAKNPENGDLAWAVQRFDNEVHRLYGVLELGLFNKKYLAGADYTIADMAAYPWASLWKSRDIEIDEFPRVKAWLEEMEQRSAVKFAMSLTSAQYQRDNPEVTLEEKARRRALTSNQRAQPVPQEWFADLASEQSSGPI